MQPIHARRRPDSRAAVRAARAPRRDVGSGTVLSCVGAIILLSFAINGAAATAPPLSATPETSQARIDPHSADLLRSTETALKRRDYPAAVASATAALATHPDRKVEAVLYHLRAFAYLELYDYAHTIDDCRSAFWADPAVKGAHRDRAAAYASTGQFSKAVTDATAAIKEETDNQTHALLIRAVAYTKLAKPDAAHSDLLAITRLPVRTAVDRADRGVAYYQVHQYKAALADYAELKRDPVLEFVGLNETAWLEATCPDSAFRNGPAAVRDALRACELSKWKQAACIDTLAVAYAETGDFTQAMRYETDALKGLRGRSRREAELHLKSFRTAQPFHTEPEL